MSIKSELDQFYTSPQVVKNFLDIIKQYNFITDKTIFIEPSAGDGKFLDELQRRYKNKILAFDIQKNHKLVKEQDFLTTDIKYSKNNLTIGNPPFGKKAKLAIEFINHSSQTSDIICFVLPIQFRRWNVQKQINPNLKLIYSSEDLPKNSFLVNNKPADVNCCLQIWISKNIDKENKYQDLRISEPPANTHEDFKLFIYNNTLTARKYFDKEKYQWDFAVVRQGFYDYNEKITNPEHLNPKRQYLFVKYINPCAKQIFNQIDFAKLSNTNTTVKGFSNTDLVAEYIKIKNKLV